jgi:hypothetical protein
VSFLFNSLPFLPASCKKIFPGMKEPHKKVQIICQNKRAKKVFQNYYIKLIPGENWCEAGVHTSRH